MKEKITVISLLLLLVLLTISTVADADDHKIKIGVIAPLTGAVAIVGSSVQNALLLLHDHNEFLKSNVEFVFEDDQFIAKNGLTAADKLIYSDKVKALIVFGSGTTLAIGNLVDNAQVPTLAMAYSDKTIVDRKFVRRFFNTAQQSAKATYEELSKRKYSTIAIATTVNETTVAVKEEFLKLWKEQPPLALDMNPSDTDVKPIALKIKMQNPPAVYIISGPPQLSLLPKTLRQIGYKGDFFMPSYGRNKAAIKASDGALEGSWLVATLSDRFKSLEEESKQRFNAETAEDGLLAYDVGLFLADALKAGNILQYFDSKNFLTGEIVTWQKLDPHTFAPELRIGHIRGNEVY